jgi:hypothetical protein
MRWCLGLLAFYTLIQSAPTLSETIVGRWCKYERNIVDRNMLLTIVREDTGRLRYHVHTTRGSNVVDLIDVGDGRYRVTGQESVEISVNQETGVLLFEDGDGVIYRAVEIGHMPRARDCLASGPRRD